MPLIELIRHMCSRPRMYVPSGSFQEVCIFLGGYDCALFEFAPEEVKAKSLGEFGRWLSYTHENANGLWLKDGKEIEANLAWCSKMQRLFPVDSEAFEAFPRLYQQFLDDPQQSAWPNWPSYHVAT